MDRTLAAAEALASAAGQQAVRAGEPGTLIRLVREAMRWRQADLGRHAGFSQPTISRLEKGRGRISDVTVLNRLAEVLCIPPEALGLAPALIPPVAGTVADVRRSDFLRGMASTAAALALPAEIVSEAPRRIGIGAVRDCEATLDRLYQVDDQRGGATIYTLATQMVEELRATLGRATFGPAAGRRLREVASATAEHAGWLAYDIGRQDEARRWWLESLYLADLAEAPQLRVIAFASMALQVSGSPDPWGGREAIDLMNAAQRIVGSGASPRLRSLLAARQALGHARNGDPAASTRGFAEADRLLDKGPRSEDGPTWMAFWGQADLACHRAIAGIYLRDFSVASRAAQAALDECDATRYPRNQLSYSNLLAEALVRDGQFDAAMATLAPVVSRIDSLGSRRILAGTNSILYLLEQHRSYRPAASFVSWARQFVPTTPVRRRYRG